MKKLSILLLVCIIGALCLSTVKCDEPTVEDAEKLDDVMNRAGVNDDQVEPMEGEDDDVADMDDDDYEDSTAVDEEWQKIVETTFGDSSAMHQFKVILDMAYQHLIYEEMDELNALILKHERKDTLNDEEAATLSNAMVAKSYVEEKFGDKTEVTNAEALEILNHDNYDTWMDNMPDDIIQKIDQFMPDETADKTDL